MSKYEGILSKIAPALYKFSQYAKYFLSNRIIIIHPFRFYIDKDDYYSSNNISYTLVLRREILNHNIYYAIFLGKSNRFMVDPSYGFTGFITTMIINNFSFEDKKLVISRAPLYLSIPAKDLFVRIVGKDIYDTIRANIK